MPFGWEKKQTKSDEMLNRLTERMDCLEKENSGLRNRVDRLEEEKKTLLKRISGLESSSGKKEKPEPVYTPTRCRCCGGSGFSGREACPDCRGRGVK